MHPDEATAILMSAASLSFTPTLSRVLSYNTSHLTTAGQYWNQRADQWEESFTHTHHLATNLNWRGAGGDALVARTHGDLKTVINHAADPLRTAAALATRSAGELDYLHHQVLTTLREAQQAGFTVGEDFSATDTRPARSEAELVTRQAQAQTFSNDLRYHSMALYSRDAEVGAKIRAHTAGIHAVDFKTGGGDDDFPPPPPGFPAPTRDHTTLAVQQAQRDQELKDYLATLPQGCSQSDTLWKVLSVIGAAEGSGLAATEGNLPGLALALAGLAYTYHAGEQCW